MNTELSVSAAAREYVRAGYTLVAWDAVHGKNPKFSEWGRKPFPAERVTDAHNIGINHALSNTASIDIDDRPKTKVLFDFLGIDLNALCKTTIAWSGREERLKLLFRAPEPPLGVKKLVVENDVIFELRGALPDKQAQDVLPPSLHPDTGKRYVLHTKIMPRDELPSMPEQLVAIWRNWKAWEPMLWQILGAGKAPPAASQAERVDRNNISVIDAYNGRVSCAEVLQRNGYESVGARWLRPGSSTGEPGVVLLPESTRIYSHGGDVLNDGHSHDAFDCFRILEHRGDFTRAVRAAAKELGIARPKLAVGASIQGAVVLKGTVEGVVGDADASNHDPALVQTAIDLGREQIQDIESLGLLSDDDLARRFTARYQNKFLYCEELGRWYQWAETHWAHDNTRAVFDAARASSRLDLAEALQADLTDNQQRALRTRLGSAVTIASIVRLASADRHHAVRVTELDSDPWLLNTPGGIVDLTTGALRPHDPARRMTKITAAAPVSRYEEIGP